MDKERLKILKDMTDMLTQSLTKKEFVESFKAILSHIKKLEENLIDKLEKKTSSEIKELQTLKDSFGQIISQANKDSDSTFSGIRRRMAEGIENAFASNNVNKRLQEVFNSVSKELLEVNTKLTQSLGEVEEKKKEIDVKLASVKDGENPSKEELETLIKELVPEVKEETSEQTRDKLEKLGGNERLKIEAIDELKEILDELKRRPTRFGGGYNVLFRTLKNQTPSGLMNGSNVTFGLAKAPKSGTEQVFQNGIRLRSGSSNDYTLSGRTLTWITAPETGDIILVDFEY